MQLYLIYGVLFASVVLLVESAFLFARGRLSGDDAANKRIRLIQKTGDDFAGLALVKDRPSPRSELAARLTGLLWAADIPYGAGAVASLATVGGLLLGFALLILGGLAPVSALLAGLMVGWAGTFLFVSMKARARRRLFSDQLIPSIDLVSRGLQAGHPAAVALEIVAKEMPDPIGTEFGLAMDEIAHGLDRNVALRNIADRFPSPEMSFFTSALEIQRETGGNLVEVLNNLTTMMRSRGAMVKKIKAISSEGRVTATVVGLLPFVMIAILTLMSPGYFTESFDDPLFVPIMAVASAFYLVGMLVIRRMINIRI